MTQSKKAKPVAPEKEKKSKLVRDSFTIPKDEYAAIDELKSRALTLGVAIKKSELLRAGLMALASMSDARLKTALAAVPTLKTGRPSSKGETDAAETVEAPAPIEAAASPAVVELAAEQAVKPARKPRKASAKVEVPGTAE
ncbi:MAG: hypothetical protein RLZZ555_163 [Pseudomonadota bacterium]|jgi:hypothetical protein